MIISTEKIKRTSAHVLAVLMLLASSVSLMNCGEEEGTNNPGAASRVIYLCGEESGTYVYPDHPGSFYSIATYWKDGDPTALYVPTFKDNGWASKAWAIVAENGDAYVAGMQHFPGKADQAVYWKNGQEHTLSTAAFHARGFDIAVENGNVYVAGEEYDDLSEHYSSKYWKNGVANVLVTKATGHSTTTGIAVADGDVYVAGTEYNDDFMGTTKQLPKVWKNSSASELFAKEGKYFPGKMTIDGDDVYVSGTNSVGTKHLAIVWKNGSYEILNGDADHAYAYDVKVYNGDVYVAGKIQVDGELQAVYWKNGVPHVMNTASKSEALGIFVKDGDVYLAGWVESGKYSSAMLWINGVADPKYTVARAYYAGVYVE